MRLMTLVFKNLFRRPLRSSLTIAGIAVAVGAIVALVGISTGFETALGNSYRQRGVDLVVSRSGVSQRLTSSINQSAVAKIAAMPEVRQVAAELVDVVSFEDLNLIGVTVYGWQPGALEFRGLRMLEGRTLKAADGGAVLLGTLLAKNLGKKTGDTVDAYPGRPLKVVGIFRSYNVYENSAMIVPLATLQPLVDRVGRVTLVDIVVKDPRDQAATDRLIRRIADLGQGLSAMRTESFVESTLQIQVGRAVAWMISSVALLIGVLGVFNTMAMAVAERTAEIGILRAIGWPSGHVLSMLLAESILLCFAGAIAGSLAAVAVSQLLALWPRTANLFTGMVSPRVLCQGFLVALGVGLVGGLLPAWRASRLLPTEALGHG